MAILALIVTPLVMNIIRKARIAADKRSIDAYGRSIELAIAGYLLDNGKFPTEISQLTIEYSGDTVTCTTEQINPDSSVYLADCTVKNRTVEGYTYGKYEAPTYIAYQVGDHISYNGVTYYVIENSDSSNNTVKLLKEIPLLKTEIEGYNIAGLTVDGSTYGKVQYGSSTDYETSAVKKVVDAWKSTAVKSGDISTARLITKQEIEDNFEFEEYEIPCGGCGVKKNRIKSSWMYNSNYYYLTMSEYDSSRIIIVTSEGSFGEHDLSTTTMVRPVLEISKTADLTKLAS